MREETSTYLPPVLLSTLSSFAWIAITFRAMQQGWACKPIPYPYPPPRPCTLPQPCTSPTPAFISLSVSPRLSPIHPLLPFHLALPQPTSSLPSRPLPPSPPTPTPFPNKRTFVPSRSKLGLRSRWVCFGLLLPLPFFVAFGHATIRYYGPCLHTSPSPPLGWEGEVFSYEPLWQTQLLVLSVAAAFARLYGSRHLLKHVGAYGLHQVREVSLWRL